MSLLMGFAQRDITPVAGIELCGHGFYLERKATGILEPIYARALAWAQGAMKGAILELEVLCIPKRRARKIKELVSMHCGIPISQIMISCLHNHSAPSTCDLMGYGELNEEYVAEFICRSAGAAIDAFGQMKPVTLEYATVPVEGIGLNRETANGPTDPELRVLRIKNDGKLISFIMNYACHPVILNRETYLVSSDFIGVALNRVCNNHQLSGLYLQGACGDINSRYVNCPQAQSLPQLQEIAAKFAGYLEEALFSSQAEELVVDEVRMVTREVDLPLQKIDKMFLRRHLRLINLLAPYADRLPDDVRKELIFEKEACEEIWQKTLKGEYDHLTTEMQALRWGQLILAAQPSELFYQYQAELFHAFGAFKIMMVGYANDYVGYIPSVDQYERDLSAASWVPFVLRLPLFPEDIGAVFTRHLIDTVRAVVD